MTLLFAALLGNFLAWCVHAFTWWLREKFLVVVSVIGCCFSGVCFFIVLLWAVFDLLNLVVENDTTFTTSTFFVICLITLFFSGVGWAQSRLVDDSRLKFEMPFVAMSAFVAEFVFATVFVFFAVNVVFDGNVARPIVFYVFFGTLLCLALIRSQVMKVQKWLWQQVKPQRPTNE